MKIIKNKPLLISVTLTILTVFNNIFFNHTPYGAYLYPIKNILNFKTKLIIIKLITCLFFYIIIKCIIYIVKKRKEKFWILFIEGFIISNIICIISLLLHFPGVWSGDTLHLFEYSTALNVIPWHNIYTSIFYILSLSIIPHPAFIVILQALLFSTIFSYIYANIFSKYPTKLRFLIFLIFTPINRYYINWVFRTSISSFLELFIIFFTIFHIKKELSKKEMFLFCILTGFICTYRLENIFYIILPIIISKNKFKVLFTIIILMTIINIPQKISSKEFYKYDYLINSTLEPMQFILNSTNNETINSEQSKIEKIIPYDYIKDYGSHSFFEYNYENNGYGTYLNKPKKDQLEYLIGALKIFIKNFKYILKSKINSFSSIIIDKQIFPSDAIKSLRPQYYFENQYNNLLNHLNETYDLNLSQKQYIINYKYKLITPLIFIFTICFILLIKLKKEFWIIIPLVFKFFTVLFFAPISSFMYYYYIYLIGYFLILYYIFKFINYKKNPK